MRITGIAIVVLLVAAWHEAALGEELSALTIKGTDGAPIVSPSRNLAQKAVGMDQLGAFWIECEQGVDCAKLEVIAKVGDSKSDVVVSAAAANATRATFDLPARIREIEVRVGGKTVFKRDVTGHAVPSSSAGGLSASTEPLLTLIADAELSSLDPTAQAASLGVERGSPWTLARIRIRKNVGESSVRGERGDRAFARAVLSPQHSNVSLAAHYELRPWSYIGCSDDCSRPGTKIHTKWGVGGAAEFEVAESLFIAKQADLTEFARHAVPIAASLGGVIRYEGSMPDGVRFGGSSHVALSLQTGFAFRMIGGDLGETDRRKILDTPTRYLWGGEVAATLQLGNLVLSPRVTFLRSHRGDDGDPWDIDGLTGPQFQIAASYQLPFNVLGKTARTKEAEDAAAARAAKQDELEDKVRTLEREKHTLEGQVEVLKATPGAGGP